MKNYTNETRKASILKYYNKKYNTRVSLKTTDTILESWLESVKVSPTECIPFEIMIALKTITVPSDIAKSWKGIDYLYNHHTEVETETETEEVKETEVKTPTETETEEVKETEVKTPTETDDKLKALEMISKLLSSPAVDVETLRKMVQEEVKNVVQPIQVEYVPIDGEVKPIKKLTKISHQKTEGIVEVLKSGLNVYLYGEAGTGKSQIAEDCAEILDLPFYFTGKCSSEYDLTGFKNAQGEYIETAFYKAFSEGGLFLFDELDASNENALIKFNSALSQGYFDFPCGNVRKHSDFICIATGNTAGKGATMRYNTRRKLDASTLDRFAMIEVDYDCNIENVVAKGNNELVNFVHDLRKATIKNDIELIVSYRAIAKIVKLENIGVFTLAEVLKMSLFGSMSNDDLVILLEDLNGNNKYVVSMSELL